MSADPERLSSDGSADPVERELLASVRNVHPPDGAKERAWQGLAGQLAAGVVVGAAAGAGAASAKVGIASLLPSSLVLKAAAVLAAGGVVFGSYVAFLKPSAEKVPSVAPSVLPPVVVAAPPPSRIEPLPVNDAPQEALDTARPKPTADSSRVDELAAESALLTEARAKLRAGDATGAGETLERMQARFPRGVLLQEREIVAIEALAARGNVPAARARAKAFVRAYPKSPHSEKLARLLDDP